jgi:hypothetical protein
MVTSVLAGDIVLNLEEPSANSTYTGIANVRGWVVGSKGINRVELYVNGELKNNIPIGGLRTDVGNQYPNYPNSSYSGYSMAFNYSGLPAGQHSIVVRAIDSEGSFKDSSATFNVTRFDNSYISNSSSVSLNGATISNDNQSIFISNMTADGKKYDIRLDWRTAIQGYTITQIIPTGGSDPNPNPNPSIWDTRSTTINGVEITYRLFSRQLGLNLPDSCEVRLQVRNTTNQMKNGMLSFDFYKAPSVYFGFSLIPVTLPPMARNDDLAGAINGFNELFIANGCKEIYSWDLNTTTSWIW